MAQRPILCSTGLYYAYGTFTHLDHLLPLVNLTDTTTLSPSPGRVVYAGLRVTF